MSCSGSKCVFGMEISMAENLPDIVQIENLINDIANVSYAIYAGQLEAAQSKLDYVFNSVSAYYTYLISNSPRYAVMGVQVPVDILYQHIGNMQEAIKYHDLMQLTDTLLYEITEGLKYLIELVKQEKLQEGES